MHTVALRLMCGTPTVQSAFVSQAMVASLLHVPFFNPSPGIVSLQVPTLSTAQQSTKPAFPHVDLAAHLAIVFFASAVRQPCLFRALRKWTTQL